MSSDDTYDIGNIKVEEGVEVIEESLMAINKEEDIDIKEEDIPEDIPLPGIKSEPDEVSYVYVCLLLDTFYRCPEMSVVCGVSIFMASWNSSTFGNENGWV
jgi:hypothetical protein